MLPTLSLLLLAPAPLPQAIQIEQASPICATRVRDAVTGNCIEASEQPALGRLYPLSSSLYVSPSMGFVGMGTTSPASQLHVAGEVTIHTVAPNAALAVSTLTDYTSAISAGCLGTGSAVFYGIAQGDFGVGAYGESVGATGTGVAGGSRVGDGTGVYGFHDGDGVGNGVEGRARSDPGLGGLSTDLGVYGWVDSGWGTGVWGEGNANDTSDGVYGLSQNSASYGIYGNSNAGGKGIVGRSTGGVAIEAQGDLTVTGVKNFAHPHPTDPSREIRFVCLEGNESGTYFRGSARLVGGRAVIAVPEEFRLVSAAGGLTVQLTAVGSPARLWVESRDLDRVVVRGDLDSDFDYQVNGVRAGYEGYRALADNRTFVPRVEGVPYGEHLSPTARAALVQNGVLNPDFTPSRSTADRLGWELQAASGPPARTRVLEVTAASAR